MKLLNIFLTIVVLTVSTALAVYLAGCNKRATRAVVVSLLQQIPRSCLVMETAEELTLASVDGGSMLLGPRCGMAAAVRRSHWGIELSDIQLKDVVVSGREVRVKLPDPIVFDTAVDLASFRFLTRRSGLQAITDAVLGRSLFRELAEIACQTPPKYSLEQIQTRRTEFARRLNKQAAALFEAKDLRVKFE